MSSSADDGDRTGGPPLLGRMETFVPEAATTTGERVADRWQSVQPPRPHPPSVVPQVRPTREPVAPRPSPTFWIWFAAFLVALLWLMVFAADRQHQEAERRCRTACRGEVVFDLLTQPAAVRDATRGISFCVDGTCAWRGPGADARLRLPHSAEPVRTASLVLVGRFGEQLGEYHLRSEMMPAAAASDATGCAPPCWTVELVGSDGVLRPLR